jgi:hypothetical protein
MSHLDGLVPHVDRLFARNGGLHPPTEVLLSWPKPNYINPDDRGWASSIVLLVFLSITFLVYIARMWARLGLGKNHGLDDTIMSIAMLPLFGLTISAVLGKKIVLILNTHLTLNQPSACMASSGTSGIRQRRLWSLPER